MRFAAITVAFVFLSTIGLVPVFSQEAKQDKNQKAGVRTLAMLESANWSDLFNGKDLSGWSGDTEGYVAEQGVLVCKKGGKNLYTEKQYSDFAFTFEFKLEESGNNGIGIRVPEGEHPAKNGMEIQILDHHGAKYNGEAEMGNGKTRKMSWLKPWQYHGSIYGVVPAKTGYLKPCLLYTSPSPRDQRGSRMPSSA